MEQAESLGILTDDEVKKIKRQAKKIIPERVGYWAEKIGVTYGRIAIRLQSSRWGSCAANGNLNFNCLLVLMSPEVLDRLLHHCHIVSLQADSYRMKDRMKVGAVGFD